MAKHKGWQACDRLNLAYFSKSGKYGGWQLYASWYFVTNYGSRLDAVAIASGDRAFCCFNCSQSSSRFFEFEDGKYCENSQALSAYIMQVTGFLNFCDIAFGVCPIEW